MSTYAIGDIQGCYDDFMHLLETIKFTDHDTVWLTGDLVNRGPKSLETLRFIKSLGQRQITVLGNHDLHLLAIAHGVEKMHADDTLTPILQAKDRDELITWLQHQPLLHHDETLGFTMVHAGLAPMWDLPTAKRLAREVETALQGPHASDFFHHLYGNHPDHWEEHLTGWERLRCITHYFTRVRFCYPDGRLEFKNKWKMETEDESLIPWFKLPHRENTELKILFGHWAGLSGDTHTPNVYALDTGCVWGNALTAMRLEDETRFSIRCNR